jgi:hypothetical protein
MPLGAQSKSGSDERLSLHEAEARQAKVLTADEAQRPLIFAQSNGLIRSWAGPGSTGTPRSPVTAAGSKRGIGSVTGDMLAGRCSYIGSRARRPR